VAVEKGYGRDHAKRVVNRACPALGGTRPSIIKKAHFFTLLRQKALWLATGMNGVLGFAGFRKDAPRLAAGCFTAEERIVLRRQNGTSNHGRG